MRVATTMRDHGQHQTCITMHRTKWRPARRSSRAVRPDRDHQRPGSIPREGKGVLTRCELTLGPLPRLIDPKMKFSNIVQTCRIMDTTLVYGTGNRLEPMQTRTARVSRIRKLHFFRSPRAANGQKRPKCESAPASHGRGGGFFRRRIGCRHGGDGCHRCRHSKPLDWSRGRPPRNRRGCRLRPTMSR